MTQRTHRRLIGLSIAAAIATMGMKATAWLLTGSVGLFSDAAESLVNLSAALMAFFAVWYAARPADAEHTYGHEKIEYFSSGMEGALIILAAGAIGWQALERCLNPQPLTELGLGLAIGLAAAAINGLVGFWLLRVGRRDRSVVLEADGHHLLTDVWTSMGVAVGLAAVWLTGWQPLDPLIALAVAASILYTGGRILWRSFRGLMDSAMPEADLALLRKTLDEFLPPGMTYHAVRTREAGARRLVDFHLLVPGEMTVLAAHAFADRLEERIELALPRSDVTIHLEPIEAKASWEHNPLAGVEPAPVGSVPGAPE